MKTSDILSEVLKMTKNDIATIRLSKNLGLVIDNWSYNNEDFTTLELNSGYDEHGEIVLDEILECVTCDFGNAEEITNALNYILRCAEDKKIEI